jgi:hypothetical protein
VCPQTSFFVDFDVVRLTVSPGAANIRPDDTPYTDGGIVREGREGDQGDGPYSAGRGGTGNIGGQPIEGAHAPHDSDMVPETAMRVQKEESHHIGRGGAGNEAHVHQKKEAGILDKIKSALHMDKK